MIFCDHIAGVKHCLENAAFCIVLDDGTEFYACGDHLTEVIRDNAETGNPVHSVDQFGDSNSLVE